MVLVSVLYPDQPGTRCDARYYLDRHIPLVLERWGGMGLSEFRLLRWMGTPAGGAAPYRVIALLSFDSAEALQRAVAAHGAEIFADIPNFTEVQPVVQVNEMLA